MECNRFIFVMFLIILSSICKGQQHGCQVYSDFSGEIDYSGNNNNRNCWIIKVPDNNYVRLNIKEVKTVADDCVFGYIKISIAVTGEEYTICGQSKNNAVVAFNDATIKYYTLGVYTTSFRIGYNTQSLVSTSKNYFWCSQHKSILRHQVCNGIKDCENGDDENNCGKGQQHGCQVYSDFSGEIYNSGGSSGNNKKCWTIKVPDQYYVRLNIKEMKTIADACYHGYITISIAGTGEVYTICGQTRNNKAIVALHDATIMYYALGGQTTTFRIGYNTQSLVSALKNYFRCSHHKSILRHQVCNGIKDCENGADEENCGVQRHWY